MANGTFVAKIRILDPTYEKGGLTYLVPEWTDWSEIAYVEPNECCCVEGHDEETCPHSAIDECYTRMCRNCRASWENDYEVQLPGLV